MLEDEIGAKESNHGGMRHTNVKCQTEKKQSVGGPIK